MKNYIFIFYLLVFKTSLGQGFIEEKGKLYATITNPEKVAMLKQFSNIKMPNLEPNASPPLMSIISKYTNFHIEKITKVETGVAKLDNWYVLTFDGNEKDLLNDLVKLKDQEIIDVEFVPHKVDLYAPNDYNEIGLSPPIQNRALELINASKAWDIRRDNTSIIGVSGESGYKMHEDYSTNVLYHDQPFVDNFHGTASAGSAGAISDNAKGIASAGFNPKLLLYNADLVSDLGALQDAINRGVKVVTVSAGVGLFYSSYEQSVIDYGYNHGVTFVAGAGNGIAWENQFGNGSICDKSVPGDQLGFVGSGECLVYPASSNHVISVTSVAHHNQYGTPVYLNEPQAGLVGYYNFLWEDLHEQIAGDINSGFHHNSKIDICAPGYFIPCTLEKDNQKYGTCWGTSFATPMTASAISLILSVNPCLNPDDVEVIIKNSAKNIYTITENQKYTGKLGAGRLDLEGALKLALEYKPTYVQNMSISSTTSGSTIILGSKILMGSAVTSAVANGPVILNSGANVYFYARNTVEITKEFEAKSGSAFELGTFPNFNPCQ